LGWVTWTFIAGVVLLLLAALAIDLWDRHHGRDPRHRGQILQTRTEQRRSRKLESSARRLGANAIIEGQFRPPADDHDIAPSRRRHDHR
jgi:hypothetical protein